MFDQTLLMVVVSIVALAIAFGLVFTHIYVHQVYKGIDFWIYGVIFEAIGFNLFLLGYYETDLLMFSFGNLSVALGLVCFYHGTNKFIQHERSYKDVAIVSLIVAVIMILFYIVFPDGVVRQVAMSSFIIFIMGRLLQITNRQHRLTRGNYLLPLIIVSSGVILLQTIRIILALSGIGSYRIFADFIRVDDLMVMIVAGFLAMLSFFMTIAVNIRVVEDLKVEREKLEHLSLTDYLTMLPNRRMLHQHMEALISKNQRFAVVISDMDEFKLINDKYGHDIGDQVIKIYADRLLHKKRDQDFIARFGGDEFITIVNDCDTNKELVDVIIEKGKEVGEPILIGDLKFELSASVGISYYPDDGLDVQEIIKKADDALYSVKQSGKNGIEFYKDKK